MKCDECGVEVGAELKNGKKKRDICWYSPVQFCKYQRLFVSTAFGATRAIYIPTSSWLVWHQAWRRAANAEDSIQFVIYEAVSGRFHYATSRCTVSFHPTIMSERRRSPWGFMTQSSSLSENWDPGKSCLLALSLVPEQRGMFILFCKMLATVEPILSNQSDTSQTDKNLVEISQKLENLCGGNSRMWTCLCKCSGCWFFFSGTFCQQPRQERTWSWNHRSHFSTFHSFSAL